MGKEYLGRANHIVPLSLFVKQLVEGNTPAEAPSVGIGTSREQEV
jgi:hypothetical protein